MTFRLLRLKEKGFCCSQMIVLLSLEAQGRTNAELVRAVGGLCYGINGGGGEVCGALSGGACLISLHAGKGADEEAPHEQYMMMMAELLDWFWKAADEYGGTRCDEILQRYPDRSICGLIVSETYRKCMDILAAYGFDPAVRRNG